jgi:hypothetical protein
MLHRGARLLLALRCAHGDNRGAVFHRRIAATFDRAFSFCERTNFLPAWRQVDPVGSIIQYEQQVSNMAYITPLYTQHREILALVDSFMRMIAGTTPPPAHDLARARWHLSAAIVRHLSSEDVLIDTVLRTASDEHAQALYRIYVLQHNKLREAVALHNGQWSIERILVDMPSYLTAIKGMVAELRKIMRWEETELYPLVARLVKSQEQDSGRLSA